MREEKLSQVRERENKLLEIIFMFSVFNTAIGAHSISEKFTGFSPLWFPQGNPLCLLSPVFIYVHVILSDKILISHSLNDKNITQKYSFLNIVIIF